MPKNHSHRRNGRMIFVVSGPMGSSKVNKKHGAIVFNFFLGNCMGVWGRLCIPQDKERGAFYTEGTMKKGHSILYLY